MVTKKDFKVLAEMMIDLLRTEGEGREFSVGDFNSHLKGVLEKLNPRFDRNKWEDYLMKGIEKLND